MALPFERWARQAVSLERKGDFSPVADQRVLDDVAALGQLQRQTWLERTRALGGTPTALEGVYAGLNAYPPADDLATVTSINGTAALWTTSLWTPVPANAVLSPSGYRIVACGTTTTSTSPGNLGFDPRIGAGSTAGSAIAGTTMGASGNVALTASITSAFWYIHGDVVFRQVRAPGANSVAYGFFNYMGSQGTSGGLAGPAAVGTGHNLLFGGTTTSYDSSVAGGFSLGAVHTVTTVTYVPKLILWSSWN